MDIYSLLVESIENLTIKIDRDDIGFMNCLIIIGANSSEKIERFINIAKSKNPNIKIIMLMQESMKQKLNCVHQNQISILCEKKYCEHDAERILKEAENDKIDGFFFVGTNKDDMGNLNILEIADYIKRKNNGGLYVYGTDVDGQIYVYRDISTYVKGLKLYNDINYFIDEVVDNI